MRIPRRHHRDHRRHHTPPGTAAGSSRASRTNPTGHGQPPADRLADAILLLWDLR